MTLILAIIAISLALIFYTIGVFSERRRGVLKPVHLFMFALGLIFDTTGTAIMSSMTNSEAQSGLQLHQITGFAAIFLMALHFLWALVVILRGDEKAKHNFHRFSLLVWLFWLIPYIVGLVIGMSH